MSPSARRPADPGRQAAHARRWWVAVTAVLAFAALPLDRFPLTWQVVFIAPALLGQLLQSRARLRAADRLAVIGALQVLAIYAAVRWVGPLDKLAALGCTLIPPLAWFAARNEPLDGLRALFLAFCMFLIGAILGDPGDGHVVGFLGAAVLALCADTSASAWEDRASWRGPPPSRGVQLRAPLGAAAAAMLLSVAVFQALAALPAPSEDPRLALSGERPAARVGLDDRFELDGTSDRLVNIVADELIRVRDHSGRTTPAGLYLRAAHFDAPGLESWTTLPRRLGGAPAAIWPLAEPVAGLRTRALEIEYIGPTEDFAFLPAGTHTIDGAQGLIGDRRTAAVRFAETPPLGHSYVARYQNVHRTPGDAQPASGLRTRLMELPRGFGTLEPHVRPLLDDPQIRRAAEPAAIADAVAAVLRERCTYDLRGPSGPHAHALANFLSGDRRGFCMHFASAAALALRLYGVPARIGVGLYGGEPAHDERGARLFGSHHAHAWVEIPLEGLGWVVFDPTPPAARESRLWPAAGGRQDQADAADLHAGDAGGGFALFNDPLRFAWLWGLLAIAALGTLRLRRPRAVHQRPVDRRTAAEQRSARKLLEQLLHNLEHQHGLVLAPGETLESFAARCPDPPSLRHAVRDACAAYQEIRFGGHPCDPHRRTRLTPTLSDPRRDGSHH